MISRSGKFVGQKLDSLETTHDNKTLGKVVHIFDDETHPLRVELDTLKSSRSSRAPSVKTNTYTNSIVPHAVRMYNCVNDRNSKRKTHMKMNTEDTLSGSQEFFLQSIIKDRSNKHYAKQQQTNPTTKDKEKLRSF